jgi:hypothetical protein
MDAGPERCATESVEHRQPVYAKYESCNTRFGYKGSIQSTLIIRQRGEEEPQ